MSGTVLHGLAIACGESLFGYMTRLAQANDYESVTWLLDGHWRNNSYDTGTWSDLAVARLAELTGLKEIEIRSRMYPRGRDDTTRIYFGSELRTSLIVQTGRKSKRRFCPICIAGGIHHGVFDLRLVEVCPVHGCATTDRCRTCGKPVLWGPPSLTVCHECGGDLTMFTEHVRDPESLLGLHDTLRFLAADGQGAAKPVHAALQHLSATETMELVIGLTRYARGNVRGSHFLDIGEQTSTTVNDALDAGWGYLRTWPCGFERFLADLREVRGTEEHLFGVQGAYGPFYTQVRKARREPWITAKAHLVHHLENEWIGNARPRPERSTKSPPIEFRTKSVPLAEAALQLGRSHKTVRRLLELDILVGSKCGDWSSAPIFIERESIERIAPGGRLPVGLYELGVELGLSPQRMRQLTDEGVLVPVFGPSIDGAKKYLFNADEAKAIIADVREHLRLQAGASPVRRFSNVLKGANARKVKIGVVIDAIRKGRLPAVREEAGGQGLDAFHFDTKAVLRMLTGFEEAEHAGRMGCLSVAMVAARFGVSLGSVASLIREGILKASEGDGALKIDLSVIEAFEARYIFVSKAARERNTVARWLHRAMVDAELPIIYCGEGCNRAAFIERSTFARLPASS